MKLNVKEILLIIFVLILSAFSLLNLRKIGIYQANNAVIKNNTITYESTLNTLKKNMEAQLETEGFLVNSKIVLLNGLNEVYTYNEIIAGKTLVIRIYSDGCSICLEKEIIRINELLNIYEINKAVFLISHLRNYQEFVAFINNNNLPIEKCYFLKNRDALEIPLELKNPYVYLFTTDTSYLVQKVFVPIPNLKNLTSSYFNIVHNLH